MKRYVRPSADGRAAEARVSQTGNVGYALDRMGWLQFEQPALRCSNSRLKYPARPAGGADRCRAVLSGAPIGPPLVGSPLPAPVLVQCIWVPPDCPERLSRALEDLVDQRLADMALARSVVLVTNLAETRGLATGVRRGLPHQTTKVRVLGPDVIGACLDARPELRRAMPSVLGLRDLDQLIDAGVSGRSTFDQAAATNLAGVFVPTRAYRRALAVLDRYRFAVLTGPPEMGKTAIARMISLAQLTNGWEAHECNRPEEIWRVFDPARRQIFVADDAFGSTEYRPDAAERWASDMERILRALDNRHWLIWTSRPAPLYAGLRRLHRERGAERFPAPAEVFVDASRLDVAEKTLILFRHAKSADLPDETRWWLIDDGAEIVSHPHFTPERIRRLVARLKTMSGEELKVPRNPRRELANPTEAMAVSFSCLESEHRDLLIAMLDTPPGPVTERDLADALRRHHDGALSEPPGALVDRLTDHFLRVLA